MSEIRNIFGTETGVGSGHDSLSGSESSDRIYGGVSGGAGTGNDTIRGDNGDDSIFGGAGNDSLLGGNGSDAIRGGGDNDVLYGENGNDSLWGDDGTDTIYGGHGNDVLTPGAGGGTVDGGEGNDTLVLDDAQSAYTVAVASGVTTLTHRTTGEVLRVTNVESFQYRANAAPVISGPLTLLAGAEDMPRILTAAELLAGASDADGDTLTISTLTITAGNGTLSQTGDGRWTYLPAAQDDSAVTFGFTVSDGHGGTATGTATLDLTPQNDAPEVAGPVDLGALAEDGSRVITEAELLAGATDADGDALHVAGLVASSGGLVAQGDGSWLFTPAADDDTAVSFTYTVTDGTATATQTATLDLTPQNDAPEVAGPVDLGALAEDGSRVITEAELLAGATDVDGHALHVAGLVASSGVLVAQGDGSWLFTPAADDDTAVSFTYTVTDGTATAAQTATLDLTPVEDDLPGLIIEGTRKTDDLLGSDGNDWINALRGRDHLSGGAGHDTLIGGTRDDTLSGGDGNDLFLVGLKDGEDLYDGGLGLDTIRADADGVVLVLNSTSLSGIEVIESGGHAGFVISGSRKADVLDFSGITLSGVDLITGSRGRDTIIGSAADDRIEGNSRADVLTGGAGADVFDFNKASHSDRSSTDLITDFTQGEDLIDLTDIDGDHRAGTADQFTFIGAADFTEVAGQLRVDTTSLAGITQVLGDTDGDGRADLILQLTGTLSLGAGDFLL